MSTRTEPRVHQEKLPSVLRTSRWLLVLLAVVHLLVPLGMWVGHAGLAEQIAAAHPDFDALTVHQSVQAALGAGIVFHLVLAAVAGALALRMPRGGRTYRRVLVVSQVLSLISGIVSWNSSPMFHLVVPVVTVVGLLLLALATFPAPARLHFSSNG